MPANFTSREILLALYSGVFGCEPEPQEVAAWEARIGSRSGSLEDLFAEVLDESGQQVQALPNRTILRALYRAALGREPDPSGIGQFEQWLAEDPAGGPMKVADALHYSLEYQQRVIPTDPARVLVDHSPSGEVRLILDHLISEASKARLIVEAGIADPRKTVAFDFLHLFGWRGILIEQDPVKADAIEFRFSGTPFELVRRPVVSRGGQQERTGDDLADRRAARLRELGLVDDPAPDVDSLTDVLAELEVPREFEILAIGSGDNVVRLVNRLVDENRFRPRIAVLQLPVSESISALQQLGFSDNVAGCYRVMAATGGSLLLDRKAEASDRSAERPSAARRSRR